MKIRIRHILTLALLAASVYGGMRYEATKIESSCLDEDSPTILNGQTYVCLTLEQATEIRKRLKERGA